MFQRKGMPCLHLCSKQVLRSPSGEQGGVIIENKIWPTWKKTLQNIEELLKN